MNQPTSARKGGMQQQVKSAETSQSVPGRAVTPPKTHKPKRKFGLKAVFSSYTSGRDLYRTELVLRQAV